MPELGEGLQVEGVGVVHRQFDRAQLVPGELVGAGAVADDRLFAEGVDRDPPEFVAAGAGEVGEVRLGLVGELDVGAGELVPGAAADRGYDRDRRPAAAASGDPPQHLRVAGDRNCPPGQPALAALQPAQSGEEQQREHGAGEQDQQHGDALVDRRLAAEVVGEAVPRLHRQHRRQRPERADRQRRQQPEAVAGEGDQAAAGDDAAPAGRRASR